MNHKSIGELLKDREPETLFKALTKMKRKLEDCIANLDNNYSIIKTILGLLMEGIGAEEDKIVVYERPKVHIILGKVTDFSNQDGFLDDFLAFCSSPHKPHLNLSYPIGGFWSSMSSFSQHPSEPTQFFSLDPNGHERIKKGLYMVGYTRGYYGQANDLPKRMENYAIKNNYVFDGPVYSLYLFDEISVADPNNYLLQVVASVQEPNKAHSRYTKLLADL
jgi:hypothetical protein